MKETNSYHIPYDKLKDHARGGVVIYNGIFYKIKYLDDKTFSAYKGKETFEGRNMHLHPYGKSKNGTIVNFGQELPFFMYNQNQNRKDVPKEEINGTDFDKVKTDSYLGLLRANLTTHIVQYNEKDGGFVVFDDGNNVFLKLRNGKNITLPKKNLHYVKNHYVKGKYKKLWFKYDPKKELPMQVQQLPVKGDAYKEYLELKAKFDPDYQRTDDYRVYKSQQAIHDKMKRLWEKLTPKQKKKVA
ncbi:hypothetical protein BPT24_197 [Tenacibaculum phage pT24]|uniref:Uncharacterized protein n=1 Tax=Tenacibaculum phage pT24 TaxID=1880590 RepID=A0A1B4XWY5_9CAUD|nr:hypothetical protein HYP10_gp197 [Tenacibaculum phage pT24]BAV39321.1 hypothetical protein BPT24_197 [Tenacibaculum phage pT24]